VVERCILMTTDPGDLVLDPTCGSGTTAYVAEQWGRRWITIDTSRVAVAIARQRLLTAKLDMYRVKKQSGESSEQSDSLGVDPHPGFVYKTVPHITLKSIAQNQNLDPIFAKWEPVLDAKLAACNAALADVTKNMRDTLELKLLDKQRDEGARSITDADRRRWQLPDVGRISNPSAPKSTGRGRKRAE
jgi:adenine-specific DNA-methyltransferase